MRFTQENQGQKLPIEYIPSQISCLLSEKKLVNQQYQVSPQPNWYHYLFIFYFQENFQDSAATGELGRGKRNTTVIEQKLRQDHTAEEKRKSHQRDLMEKMNDAALKRIKDGGDDKVESKVCNKKYSNTRKNKKDIT